MDEPGMVTNFPILFYPHFRILSVRFYSIAQRELYEWHTNNTPFAPHAIEFSLYVYTSVVYLFPFRSHFLLPGLPRANGVLALVGASVLQNLLFHTLEQ